MSVSWADFYHLRACVLSQHDSPHSPGTRRSANENGT